MAAPAAPAEGTTVVLDTADVSAVVPLIYDALHMKPHCWGFYCAFDHGKANRLLGRSLHQSAHK